jgi:hypothetical protein
LAKLNAPFQTLKEQSRYLERIAVRKGGRIFVLDVADIDWIGSESGLIFIHTKEEWRFFAEPAPSGGIPRGVYPERDSLVASLPQNDKE